MWWSGNRLARRIATVAVLVTGATVLVPIQPGRAAGSGEPFYGDLDRDGHADRVTLAPVPANGCPVRVERGRPGGGYHSPRTYYYPEPGEAGIGGCADMGVVVDLGGDGRVELVLAWFAGRPEGVDADLLMLRDFTPAGGFTAIFQPSFLGTADFDGDGRLDLYEWTDQGEGFRSYLNMPDGQLVPGPVRWCFFNVPQITVADFHPNGRADVALAYTQGCDGSSTGVVVVRDDGSPLHLEEDLLGEQWWSMEVADRNADDRPDVATKNAVTGEVTHHLGQGGGGFVKSPRAVADRVLCGRGTPTRIRILDNDAATRDARVTLVQQPANGTAQVAADRTVLYTPRRGTTATTDRFVYRLLQDGKQSTTSVSLRLSAPG